MTLRLATERDLPRILEIYAPYVEEETVSFEYETPTLAAFEKRFRSIASRLPWLVAEKEGKVVGYAYLAPAFVRAGYAWDVDLSIYVERESRRGGIGRMLEEKISALARELGYARIYSVISAENGSSLAFHRRMGYREAARFARCGFKFGRWIDVVWYEKELGGGNAPAFPLAFGGEL